VIAFATSLLVAIAGDVAILAYSKRRPVGAYLSWGEAVAAAVFALAMMLMWYGVVPHQWITLADAQWNWRADRLFFGPGDLFKPNHLLPFTVTYQALRDIVVTVIYGAGLTLHVFHFVQWQNRSKTKAVEVATTAYGRPLARKS
jgi:hypothetical protein